MGTVPFFLSPSPLSIPSGSQSPTAACGEERRGLVVADDFSAAGSQWITRPSRAAIAQRWQVFMVMTWLKTSETGRPPSRMQR